MDIETLVNSTSSAYEASRVIKPRPGKMFGASFFNGKASTQYVLVFDATTLPADGTAPTLIYTLSAGSTLGVDFGVHGRNFTRGIVVCNSSVAISKTIGSADCTFDVQYL